MWGSLGVGEAYVSASGVPIQLKIFATLPSVFCVCPKKDLHERFLGKKVEIVLYLPLLPAADFN